MALWRCTQMEKRCRRKFVSSWSPETEEMRRPNSARNSAPSAFTGPRVSKAMGTNTWVEGNSAFLHCCLLGSLANSSLLSCRTCQDCCLRQIWCSTSVDHCGIPGHVSSSRPGNEYGTIGPLAIGSQKTRWFLHAWNICTLQWTPNDIFYGMMILLFITVSKKSYGIVDKNILCRIKNIQSYKLVFCFSIFLYLLFLVHHVIH